MAGVAQSQKEGSLLHPTICCKHAMCPCTDLE